MVGDTWSRRAAADRTEGKLNLMQCKELRLSHAISLPAMAVSVTPTYRSAPLLDKPNAARSRNHRTTGLFSRSTQFVP